MLNGEASAERRAAECVVSQVDLAPPAHFDKMTQRWSFSLCLETHGAQTPSVLRRTRCWQMFLGSVSFFIPHTADDDDDDAEDRLLSEIHQNNRNSPRNPEAAIDDLLVNPEVS